MHTGIRELREPIGWYLMNAAHVHTPIRRKGDEHRPIEGGSGPWSVTFGRLGPGGIIATASGRTLRIAWAAAYRAATNMESYERSAREHSIPRYSVSYRASIGPLNGDQKVFQGVIKLYKPLDMIRGDSLLSVAEMVYFEVPGLLHRSNIQIDLFHEGSDGDFFSFVIVDGKAFVLGDKEAEKESPLPSFSGPLPKAIYEAYMEKGAIPPSLDLLEQIALIAAFHADSLLKADKGYQAQLIEEAIDRMGWPEIHAFYDERRKGQDIREDAGGFMLRNLKALFGMTSKEAIENYKQAARRLVDQAKKEGNL